MASTRNGGPADGGRADRRYRISAGDPAAEVRRVAAGRIESAVEALEGAARPEPGTVPVAVAVHSSRKDMKKLRSLLRLVRPALGDELFRRENARYRDAARRLSSDRDAEIRFTSAVDLLRRYPERHPEGTERLMAVLESEREGTPGGAGTELLRSVAVAIAAGRPGIADWPLGGLDASTFGRGLRRATSRGRRAMRRVEERPLDPLIHEWRKRVKDLWYMARLLRDRWPATGEPPVGAAGRLAELLGEYQDLTVLRAWLGPAPERPAAHLVDLARLRQDEILGEALPAGRRLYG